MTRMAMSPAAAALLRALIARAGVDRERILLTDVHSADWQSLTFTGERHQLALRIGGREAATVAARLCDGLEDAEFSIPGMFVGDIAPVGSPRPARDGSVEVVIEALTIAGD